MCGIFVVHRHSHAQAFKPLAEKLSKTLSHRGPDDSGSFIEESTILCHERLAIVGLGSGHQPIVQPDVAVVVNGEIYNHAAIRDRLAKPEFAAYQTDSDSEAVIHAYRQYGTQAPHFLDGIFSFALYDRSQDRLIVARDPIGVTSLYQGWNSNDTSAMYFASELKALHPVCDYIMAFPPGHVLDSKGKPYHRYDNPSWRVSSSIPAAPVNYDLLRESFVKAVRKRMMSDVPYGVLLSGGLDSSLVASIAARELKASHKVAKLDSGIAADSTFTLPPRLPTFSIGLEGSPDTIAAARVANFLDTDHRTFHFTVEEGIGALSDVINHIETYDVTSVRASTPMFILSKRIRDAGYKMVMSGEGSDEIFGGYLYFASAPSPEAFHKECLRRIQHLHLFDCQRAHKSTMAHGLEARVPFLDKEFMEVAMSIDPREKQITPSRIEKYILRKAFDTPLHPYLPNDILWRQKEQFSDGVGYGWIDILKELAAACITPAIMRTQPEHWSSDPPETKEAYLYRRLFDQHFPPQCAATVEKWAPIWTKETDPSGRVSEVHVASTVHGKRPEDVGKPHSTKEITDEVQVTKLSAGEVQASNKIVDETSVSKVNADEFLVKTGISTTISEVSVKREGSGSVSPV